MPNNYNTIRNKLLKAFPQQYAEDAEKVIDLMYAYISTDMIHGENVCYKGEMLTIPYRIYIDADILLKISSLSEMQRFILYCIGTRNNNGRVREKYLKKLSACSLGFEIPFIFQLLGEYVTEIFPEIDGIIKNRLVDYIDFIAENQYYFKKTEDRMISYWNCYEKRKCCDRKKYLGYIIFEGLKQKLKIRNSLK